MTEAIRDDDESLFRDGPMASFTGGTLPGGSTSALEEEFLDFNKNGTFDVADGKYNGTLCAAGQTKCGSGTATSLHVRNSLQIIMSGSSAIIVSSAGGDVSSFPGSAYDPTTRTFTVNAGDSSLTPPAKGGTIFAQFVVRDVNDEPMPAGTTIALTASGNGGSVSDPSAFTVPCMTADDPASNTYTFGVTGADDVGTGVLTLKVTSPSGVQSIYQYALVSG
jgi:hypothetical protein